MASQTCKSFIVSHFLIYSTSSSYGYDYPATPLAWSMSSVWCTAEMKSRILHRLAFQFSTVTFLVKVLKINSNNFFWLGLMALLQEPDVLFKDIAALKRPVISFETLNTAYITAAVHCTIKSLQALGWDWRCRLFYKLSFSWQPTLSRLSKRKSPQSHF